MSEKRIGINCGVLAKQYGDDRALEICAEAGFDAVDFGLERFNCTKGDLYSRGEDAVGEYFTRLAERARAIGIEISQTHGRCATFRRDDPAHNEQVRRLSRLDLLATSALGAPYCVIHSITSGRWVGASPEEMRRANLAMYGELFPIAEAFGVGISLETFGDAKVNGERVRDFFGCIDELAAQYDALPSHAKTICMDTGHTHKAHDVDPSVPDAPDAIRRLGSRIGLLHLNDNNGASDQHLPPLVGGGGGYVDWSETLLALEEIGYAGVYSFELSTRGYGTALEDAVLFLGKYLRRFVNGAVGVGASTTRENRKS